MWPNPQEPVLTFTEEILNGKLHFLCSVELLVATVSQKIFMMIQYASSEHQTNLQFIQRKNRHRSSNESNIPYDSKAVSTELYEKFIPDIKTAAEDNNFKNQTPGETRKQICLSDVMGNLLQIFCMDQLKKLEEVHPIIGWANITQILKISIDLTGCVLKMARRKLNLMSKELV